MKSDPAMPVGAVTVSLKKKHIAHELREFSTGQPLLDCISMNMVLRTRNLANWLAWAHSYSVRLPPLDASELASCQCASTTYHA